MAWRGRASSPLKKGADSGVVIEALSLVPAAESVLVHYVQHATFLGASLLFWWPIIGADPSPWRLPHLCSEHASQSFLSSTGRTSR